MWTASIASLLAILAQPTPGTSPNGTSQPIVTRQLAFTIPYQIDRPDQISQEPSEVRLFVSVDRGANWRLYGKVEPSRGSFYFRAAADGEYWFTVQTLDRSGHIRPPWPQAPILRVLVDTSPPTLELKAQRGQAGQVTAQWEVRDQWPKAESLRLHYRLEGADTWQPVAVSPHNFKLNGTLQTGEVTWWPNATKGILQIRAECADGAGNPAVSHAQVSLAPPADAAQSTSKPVPTPKPEPSKPLAEAAKPAAVTAQPSPPIANQPTPPPAARNPAAPPRSRMVNSRVFELEYDVSAAGPAGVSRVELWGTRDGGRSWSSFAVDDDNRSPLLVKTDAEGLYGFRVVVRTGNGQGGQPPKSGDPPQIWIGVDLTPPALRLLRVQPVAGQPGHLQIAWEASDSLLSERPISLFYSGGPQGPWLPIAGGLANTGQYMWLAERNVPDRVFIRVEARDEAGNTAAAQTPYPILLQRDLPTAQIPLGPGGPAPIHR